MSSEGGPSSQTPAAEMGVLPSVVESSQSSTRTVAGEYRSLFAPYRQHVPLPYKPFLQPAANKKRRLLDPKVKTPKLWRHSFVFLQRKDAVFNPDSRERGLLLSAGYGEKKLEYHFEGHGPRTDHLHSANPPLVHHDLMLTERRVIFMRYFAGHVLVWHRHATNFDAADKALMALACWKLLSRPGKALMSSSCAHG